MSWFHFFFSDENAWYLSVNNYIFEIRVDRSEHEINVDFKNSESALGSQCPSKSTLSALFFCNPLEEEESLIFFFRTTPHCSAEILRFNVPIPLISMRMT